MSDQVQSRRDFVRRASARALLLAASASALRALDPSALFARSAVTPDEALERLRQGNRDYVAGHARAAGADAARRTQLARTQAPFAVVVSCSDSRVPPELLFASGIGDLFIIRNAGNTVDTAAMGSVEYGTLVLGAPLVVVLGHERCGAVDAALHVVEDNKRYPGSIGRMIEPIVPAVLQARSGPALHGDALLEAAVRQNVLRVAQRLREEPTLGGVLKAGTLKVVGARYDLDDGRVEFLG